MPTPLHFVRDASLLVTQRSVAAAQGVLDVFGRSPEILEAVSSAAMMSAITTLVICRSLSLGKKQKTKETVLDWFQSHSAVLDAIDNTVVAGLEEHFEKKGH